jgi:hypothetical protein
MKLAIKKIILWPRNHEKNIRIIDFNLDNVNVVTGDSEKGKSSLLFIIDYCLGSSSMKIPSGIIRKSTEWCGLLLTFDNREILVARKINLELKEISNDMFFKEGLSVEIPLEIISEHKVADVKYLLNRHLGYSDIGFESKTNNNTRESQSPSYRNAISLNFQPQYIVANPSTLFYKIDLPEDREKLKIALPYLLNIYDNDTLLKKEELKSLNKQLKSLEQELKENLESNKSDSSELVTSVRLAREYGLTEQIFPDNAKADSILNELQSILTQNRKPIDIAEKTQELTETITILRNTEIETSQKLTTSRDRLFNLKRLFNSQNEYFRATDSQHNRAQSVKWIQTELSNKECPFCGNQNSESQEYIESLKIIESNIDQVKDKLADSIFVSNKEIKKVSEDILTLESQLNQVRNQLNLIFEKDLQLRSERYTNDGIERFKGRIERLISNYQNFDNTSLIEKITEVKDKIIQLTSEIDYKLSVENSQKVLDVVSKLIKKYIKIFNPDRYDGAIIKLDLEKLTLTIQVEDQSAPDFLWEIGSGHNYMAFHLSAVFAIHEYLHTLSNNKVPNFIILDQPSQVYFPEIKDDKTMGKDDVARLRKIFEASSIFNLNVNGEIQLIILEHAGEDAWEGFKNIIKIKRWRDDEQDKALIPDEWIS